jgi:hypothetical protein
MEQNVAGCPSSFMDKGQHWLKDLLCAYTNKHTEVFMIKIVRMEITATNSLTP